MKRERRAEGEQILANAESTLRQSLIEMLPTVVESGDALFTNSQFNPHGLPAHSLSKRAEALLETSLACVEMREALSLPVVGSVGWLYLEACKEAASSNDHRRGPRKLAAAVLGQLRYGA
jgi:hypothetical protein